MSVDSERSRRRRKHSSSDEEEKTSSKKKERRGRPPTTGQYIGLAKAKRELVEAERLAMELEAERDVVALTRNLPRPRLSTSTITEESGATDTASALRNSIYKALETIMGVRNKSKNLSGPMMRALSEAVDTIRGASSVLFNRTTTQETRALEAENTRLTREMKELREEMEALRRDVAAASLKAKKLENTQSAAPPPPDMEEVIKRAVAEAVAVTNARMSARFEGLEARLLPAPRLRPPLNADNNSDATPPAVQMPSHGSSSVVSTLMPPANPAKTPAPKKGSKKAKDKTKTPQEKEKVAPPPRPTKTKGRGRQTKTKDKEEQKGGGWQTVTKKGKTAQKRKEGPKPKEKSHKTAPAKRGPPKLRTPQSSAVVIQLQTAAAERGVTYRDVLSKAKESIRLGEHGIPALEMKVAATGGRLLVLPGPATGEKADILARLVREAVGDDVVKVSRPVKCVGVRVSGLDDHSQKECVVAAIAEQGAVSPEQVHCGEISRLAGIGTVIVQCPVEAAKRLTEKGRLLVGWVSARIKLLDARPLRCFKCLEIGHTAAVCQSAADRSGLCFRCGEEGHRANACKATAPKCAVCSAAGRSSGHKMGGRACVAPTHPRTRGGKRKKAGDGPRAPPLPDSNPSTSGNNAANAGVPAEAMVTDGASPTKGAQEERLSSGTRT